MPAVGIGVGLPFGIKDAGGFSTEYQTVYDSFTTPPSASVAEAQNIMVTAMVDAGVWAKLDVFYVFAQESNGDSEALKNWINPGTNDAALFNGPSFVSLEGFTGNGTTQRINADYNASTEAINYSQNSASAGCYIRTNVAETKNDFGATSSNNRMYLLSRNASDKAQFVSNDNTIATSNAAVTDSRGFWVVTRTAVTTRAMYKNAVHLVTGGDSAASVGVPNDDFQFLAFADIFGYSTKQQSIGFTGGGLTQQNVTDFKNAVEVYMDSNGKGVIA